MNIYSKHFYLFAILLLLVRTATSQIDTTRRDSTLLLQQESSMVMFSVASALPALPSISYDFPQVIGTGTAISYLPSNIGGAVYSDGDVVAVAGSVSGFVNGAMASSRFNVPVRMVSDPSGNIYICDVYNHRIRKLTPDGQVSTFVGSGTAALVNGTGTNASIYGPNDIARDASGNFYISDRGNHVVRKVTPSGVVTTLAGAGVRGYAEGSGISARFNAPAGIAVDGSGNVYVVDEGNYRVRKITPSGVVSTFVGGSSNSVNGTGTAAGFHGLKGIARDASGNFYLAEYNAGKIRKITPSGVVTTLAGSGTSGNLDGTGTAARFYLPTAVTVDALGNIYVTQMDHRIRKVTPGGVVTTVAGTGTAGSVNGSPLQSMFNGPEGILAMPNGEIYIGDSQNHRLRKMGKDIGYSISPSLPAGLSFNRATGAITGTATVAASAVTYTVTAFNAAGSSETSITFSIGTVAKFGSAAQNFIMETVMQRPYLSTANLTGKPVDSVNRSISYFDGLGRPLQEVYWQASPGKKDVVQVHEYDDFGRESRRYLPYAENTFNNGAYKSNGIVQQGNYYGEPVGWDSHVKKTQSPFSVMVYENSPLSRIVEQGYPGDTWQPASNRANPGGTGRTMVTEYGTNGTSAGESVKQWAVSYAGNVQNGASSSGNYAAGTLRRTTTKNENWTAARGRSGTEDTYTDFHERVVLRRQWNGTVTHDTYYVYNSSGELCYVVPPAVLSTSFGEADGIFESYIYGYHYDRYGRLKKKKVAGKGWEWFAYDRNDREVLRQDALQRQRGEWMYSKYNAFGALVISGVYTNASLGTQESAQAAVDAHISENANHLTEYRSGTSDYTNRAFPTSSTVAHITNFYDDYLFPGASTVSLQPQGIVHSSRVRTLPTGTKVTDVNGGNALLTINYYDDRGRLVQSASQNQLGGTDYITNVYNFTDALASSKREHRKGSGSVTTVLTTNLYDHAGRLMEVRKKMNALAEIVQSRMSYNEIGQLKLKELHAVGGSAVQYIDYGYNERGWTTGINDPAAVATNRRFGQKLNYADGGNSYNGNIASQQWKTQVGAGQVQTAVQGYTYSYDDLNRLRKAAYTATGKIGFFNEEVAYDRMGNIDTLRRSNGSLNWYNHLRYSYSGNRLTSVNDAGTAGRTNSFVYDVNGNGQTNSRLGITDIQYNYLNLPRKLVKGTDSLLYIYDATGKKLTKKFGTVETQYVDGFQYKDGALEFIQTEEGRILPNGSSYIYEYFLKDHLGNTRAIVDHTGAVKQIQDYYAFGMEMNTGSGLNSASNLYKYNGKEKQQELGLDQLDYGARFYDAELGRWSVPDPKAEVNRRWSPYRYAYDNPLRFIDPDGMLENDSWLSRTWSRVTSFFGGKDKDEDKKPKIEFGTPTATVIPDYDNSSVANATAGALIRTISHPSQLRILNPTGLRILSKAGPIGAAGAAGWTAGTRISDNILPISIAIADGLIWLGADPEDLYSPELMPDRYLMSKGGKQGKYDDELSPQATEDLLNLQKQAKRDKDTQLSRRIDTELKRRNEKNKQKRDSRGY